MKTAVFTIASKNYFAYVRTIMQSLEMSNPHMDRFAVVVDDLDDEFVGLPRNFELLALDALKLPHPNCFKFRYDIMEFNTAVKPYAILKLFETYDRVIYLDPDIYVYKKLQLVEDALDAGSNFVFTPHFNGLFEDDNMHPDEPDIMRAGIYNLGFIALNKSADTIEMATWWAEKLEYQCVNEQEKGIFVDQKWMDLVPGYYENVCILHNSGLNVAYWNVSHRKIVKKNGEFFVNGDPLIFFHFSGLNPNNIDIVSKHQNRFVLADLGDGAELFENYSKAVLSNEFDMWKKFKYSYNKFSDGRPVLNEHRVRYRNDNNLQGYCEENPFEYGWLFYGDKEMTFQTGGVNLIGYLYSEHGVGEAARLTANCLEAINADWCGYDFEIGNPCKKNDKTFKDKVKNYIKYDISIINVNADQMPVLKQNTPKELWDTYKIGIWYWELPEFPEQWMKAFFDIDEIWAPTQYVAECLQKCAPCPVYHMPPGIVRKEPDKAVYNRSYYGLPEDAFLFLNMFDVYSFSGRKNPEAAVIAFQKAFRADDMSVGLVLKLNNSRYNDEDDNRLKELIGEYKNIYIIAKTMPRDAVNGLLNICDVAVSLHRSEGLGLLCEEAMFFGKPVIATGWSGNMDFMTKECACLVDYDMISVGKDIGPYEAWQKWADPKIRQAAEYMKQLVNDRDYYACISKAAEEYIKSNFSPEVCGTRMKKRLEEIAKKLENGYVHSVEKSGMVMARFCLPSYQKMIGRTLSLTERDALVKTWIQNDVIDFDAVAADMAKSGFVKQGTNRDNIIKIYQYILGRVPADIEVDTWLQMPILGQWEQTIAAFLKSEEFMGSYAEIYRKALNKEKKRKNIASLLKRNDSQPMLEKAEDEKITSHPEPFPVGAVSSVEADVLDNVMIEELRLMNMQYDIPYYNDLKCGGLSALIKRIIRRINLFLLMPIVNRQTEFNAHVVRYFNASQQKISILRENNMELQRQLEEASIQRKDNEKKSDKIIEILTELNEHIGIESEELKKYVTDNYAELESYIDIKNVELERHIDNKNVELEGYIDNNTTDVKKYVNDSKTELLDYIGCKNAEIVLHSNQCNNTAIEVAGSRHNQIIHYLYEILNSARDEEAVQDSQMIKEAIKEKWKLVDRYEAKTQANHVITCPICACQIETNNASRLVSECIFNGGKLIRYVCPKCGVIFGPEKMLNLNEEDFASDYKMHYAVYSEGDSTEYEKALFKKLNPNKEGIYLDWGVGAWSTVIASLREEGYQIYGYDPYAPINSEYIITDELQLKSMKFDGIFSHDLLEHLKDPLGTFKLFAEILKPNGKMVHSTACYDYVYEYTRFHLFFYTGTSIDELCNKTGFVVDNVERDPANLLITYSYSIKA